MTTLPEQSTFIRTRMHDYFARLAALSANRPPPGKNAANGFWHDETLADPALKQLESKPPVDFGGRAGELLTIFGAFQAAVRNTFQVDTNYEAKWETNFQLFWPIFKNIAGELIKVIQDIFALFCKDEKKQEAARKKIFDDLEALYNKVAESGLVSKGTHANGHISEGVKGAADAAIKTLDTKFPKGADTSDLGRLADSLRLVCFKLSALPTDGHKPWLRADWQVAYQGAMEIAAAGLAR